MHEICEAMYFQGLCSMQTNKYVSCTRDQPVFHNSSVRFIVIWKVVIHSDPQTPVLKWYASSKKLLSFSVSECLSTGVWNWIVTTNEARGRSWPMQAAVSPRTYHSTQERKTIHEYVSAHTPGFQRMNGWSSSLLFALWQVINNRVFWEGNQC